MKPNLVQNYYKLVEEIYQSVLNSRRWQSAVKSVQSLVGLMFSIFNSVTIQN